MNRPPRSPAQRALADEMARRRRNQRPAPLFTPPPGIDAERIRAAEAKRARKIARQAKGMGA